MTRITYKTQENGTLINKYPILMDTQFIGIEIHPLNTMAYVFNNGGEVMNQLTASTLPLLKIKIKKYLKDSGVKFGDEIRNICGSRNISVG